MKDYINGLYARLEELSEKPLTLGHIEEAAVADASGIPHDIPRWAWGVTMNMMYSDYYDVARKFGVNVPEFYAELARAFLMDKDGPGPEEKLCAYYRCIAHNT